ncbi:unnamed protein product [Amoebophrya sp. A25]|nr:unnamed protein product [Amoebophrya sp. A25]|eukprot:GSA25T00001765001.1
MTTGSAGSCTAHWTPLSDAEWQARLTSEEFEILRRRGTEPAGKGEYANHFSDEAGFYACRGCGLPLYPRSAKFRSGCGWPAYNACYFSDALGGSHVSYARDDDHGRTRLEALCKRCGSHLGHVFLGHKSEGETERHCVNSLSVRWVPTTEEQKNAHSGEKKNLPTVGLEQLNTGLLSEIVPDKLRAELDDVKYAADDSRNKPLSLPVKNQADESGKSTKSCHGEELLRIEFSDVWSAVSDAEKFSLSRLESYWKILGFKSVPAAESTAENLLRYMIFSDEKNYLLDSRFGGGGGGGAGGVLFVRKQSAGDPEKTYDNLGLSCRPSTIPGAGQGLFATRNFRKDEWICVYFGRRVGFQERMKAATTAATNATTEESHATSSSGAPNTDYRLGGFGLFSVDALQSVAAARYINHGSPDQINAKFAHKSRTLFHAIAVCTRDVTAGEEFFIDYGSGYWRARSDVAKD